MNNPGILALSIYKDSDGTTYQLDGSKIAPDSEGYIVERNISPTARGTERKKNAKHTFEIRHNDESFHTLLTADSDFGNDVWRLAIAEFNSFVLWYEDSGVNCIVEEAYVDPENEGFPYTIRMVSFGSAIARGTNLSFAYAKTQGSGVWEDLNTDNIADTWREAGSGPVLSFAGDIQTIDAGGTNRGIEQGIQFPLSNIAVTFSMEQVSGRFNGCLIRFRTLNFAGSTITETTNTVSEGATGRQSVTATTDSTIYTLEPAFVTDASAGANTDAEIRFPSVRLNDSTEYIDG